MIQKSIGAKLAVFGVIVFFCLLLIQWYLIRTTMDDFHLESKLTAFREVLEEKTANFTGGNGETSDPGLLEHAAETGAPVLAFTAGYEIADGDFFSHLTILSVDMPGLGEMKVITASLVNSEIMPYLSRGRSIEVSAVPVGDTPFWEPVEVIFNDQHYVNKGGVYEYTAGGFPTPVTAEGRVAGVDYALPKDRYRDAAKYIYDNIKNLFIYRLDMESYLDSLCRGVRDDQQGATFQFLYEKAEVAGQVYYFVTARQVAMTDREQSYVSSLFWGICLTLMVALALCATLITTYISRPLIKLGDVAKKLAALDFSTKADIIREDEIGRLSRNINTLSYNLNRAMGELRAAEEEARGNETQMRSILTDLAHEMRTPLGIISFNTEIFEKGLYENTQEYFQLLYNEIDKLSSMVNEAIDLARMQIGFWNMDIAPWDLGDVINPSIKRLGGRLRQNGFTVTVDLVEASVMADARRIDQVMVNFLNNALKYSDERRQIKIIARAEGNYSVRIFVGNSGKLSEGEKNKIWDRYYRKTRQKPSPLPSEGIGLDFVSTILDAHQSYYGVDTQDGMVWFFFTLATTEPALLDEDE